MDNGKQFLVISTASKQSILQNIMKEGDFLENPFNSNKFLARNVRKISQKMNIKIPTSFYNRSVLNYTNDIIVFDACITKDYLRWLKENSKSRIIFWYWNPVKRSLDINDIPKGIEVWTYSSEDSKKYGLKYNTQFYFDECVLKKTCTLKDIYFVGCDKGRLKNLLLIQDMLQKEGFSVEFHITPTRWYMTWSNNIYKRPISYDEVLQNINCCKAVLDIYVDPHVGYSLRVMESIFFEKKLITNNKNIVKEDFYEKSNIFLLKEDFSNLGDIIDFMKLPYKKMDNRVREKLTYKNWKNRFN